MGKAKPHPITRIEQARLIDDLEEHVNECTVDGCELCRFVRLSLGRYAKPVIGEEWIGHERV